MPGDLSSAAFLIAAGVLVKGSRLVLEGVGVELDPHRLPADPRADGRDRARRRSSRWASSAATSRSATSTSRSGPIEGTTVEPDEVPLAIDELPLVALLGCFAEGETVVRGAGELRVKESDRIADRRRRAAGARRRDRGDRRRVRRARHRRPARRPPGRPRRPPAGAARRGRGAGVERTASRSSGSRRRRSPTRRSPRTSAALAA